VIRKHARQLRHGIDDQSLPVRLGITLGALLALPLLGTGGRALGSALGLGWATLPVLVVAHVPAVIAVLGAWSIGREFYSSR
jgi:hypothetical protein